MRQLATRSRQPQHHSGSARSFECQIGHPDVDAPRCLVVGIRASVSAFLRRPWSKPTLEKTQGEAITTRPYLNSAAIAVRSPAIAMSDLGIWSMRSIKPWRSVLL